MLKMLIIGLLFLLACATTESSRIPYDELINQPVPTTETELQKECLWIRQEIINIKERTARRLIYAYNPREAVFYQSRAMKKITYLEHRAAMIGCPEFRY